MKNDIEAFLKYIFLMTGREELLEKKPDEFQLKGINTIYPFLEEAAKKGLSDEAKSDLLNRILLSFGIKPFSPKFFDIVFNGVDFSKIEKVKGAVEKFRQICMLDYGNFRYGYKILKDDANTLKEKWDEYFPNDAKIKEKEETLRNKPEPAVLIAINPDNLFSLGYIASEESKEINKYRKELKEVLEHAIEKEIDDITSMKSIAEEAGKHLPTLISKVAIPDAVNLLPRELSQFPISYAPAIKEIKEKCVTVDDEQIKDTKNKGKQNANAYLAMHDLNVYVATSMRDSLDFTTNWRFMQELFHKELKDLHISYFDPTQKYLGDRIQEGVMECLMIMRASITVYNAQESDTFGKDAELGVTLARGKPAVVYVARLFEANEEMKKIYYLIDTGARQELREFEDSVIKNGFLDEGERGVYLAPGKTKNHIIEFLIEKRGEEIINTMSTDEIAVELVRKGYKPPEKDKSLVDRENSGYKKNIIKTVIHLITKLEKRALIFREIHPLSLQTSALDGVARGIMVTRDIHTTAEVLKKMLTHSMKYAIEEEKENWILRDELTNSPVRAVTKNFILTNTFWSEQAKSKNKY